MTEISIIIPCYNQEKYIADCLESVLAQTFEDYEAIVIDDGSTDNSVNIVKKYQKKSDKIRLIQQPNQGVVSARNNAIKQAKGKYIYPLDADDVAHPEVLKKSYQAIESGKGDIISCKVMLFSDSNQQIMHLSRPTKINMIHHPCIVNSSLFRRSDFEKCGGYDKAFDKGLEDYDLWPNMILNYNLKIHRINDFLFFYRIKNANESRNHFAENHHDELRAVLCEKYPQLRKDSLVNITFSILRFFFQKK